LITEEHIFLHICQLGTLDAATLLWGAVSGVPQALCSARRMVQDGNISKTALTPSKQNMRQLKMNS